jgi:type I restriction enzyme M protein
MANPPFNVDKVKAESTEAAGRLPFGMPAVNQSKEVGNGNYLWISYFYAYLNEIGRAGFVMASSSTDSQGKDKNIREQLVKTGHVDVMVSVGNNFFYTKSLPCSLWFFDKGKSETLKEKILFIDARNYFTVVDRTLNEWSDWQLKNLNAIVWLYRGEVEKYHNLIAAYLETLHQGATVIKENAQVYRQLLDADRIGHFDCVINHLFDELKNLKAEGLEKSDEILASLKTAAEIHKKCTAGVLGSFENIPASVQKDKLKDSGFNRLAAYKKALETRGEAIAEVINSYITILQEVNWLTGKFGIEGKYADIPGLCKIASIAEVEEKNWSLTPGAYVGVAQAEDDGVDFAERMHEIHAELLTLQKQSNELMEKISANFKELGI